MAKADGVFIYIGTYPSEMSARDDYEIVKDLHAVGAVGTYDASVVTKDDSGKVHVNKDETSTRHGAWGGTAVGAVVGILFPPSLIGSAAIVGAGIGGVGGHLWKGMSRSDVKEFGELIDAGEACLLVVGESTIEAAIDKADLKAEKHIAKELERELEGHRPGRAGSRQRSQLAPVSPCPRRVGKANTHTQPLVRQRSRTCPPTPKRRQYSTRSPR